MEKTLCSQDKWGSENFTKWGVSVLVGPEFSTWNVFVQLEQKKFQIRLKLSKKENHLGQNLIYKEKLLALSLTLVTLFENLKL